MHLITEVGEWQRYWRTVTSPEDVERQLTRLRWLEDFAFHSGSAIHADTFRALQQQIEMGQKKLAELRGDFAMPSQDDSAPGQPAWVDR